MPTREQLVRHRQNGIVLALVALEASMGIYLATYGQSLAAWLLLGASLVAAILGVGPGIRLPAWRLETLLLLLVVGLLAYGAVMPYWSDQLPYAWIVRAGALLGLGAVGIAAWRDRTAARPTLAVALGAVIALGLVAHVAAVVLVPLHWDVGAIHEAAGQALLDGTNPYATHAWHGGYPYLPLSAVAAAAGILVGDVRWPTVVANAASVALLAMAGMRLGVTTRSLALGAIWLWTTASLFVTGQAFYEPLVVALSLGSLVALLSPRRRVRLAGLLIGLGAAVKQFGLGLVPFLPVRSPGAPVAALIAVLTVVAVCIPFAILDLTLFAGGTFLSLAREPPRAFALNLLNLPDGRTMIQMPLPVALALAAAGSIWAARQWSGRRWGDAISRWLAGSATLFLIVFTINGISFVNYYLLVIGLWLPLILVADRRAPTVGDPVTGSSA